MIEPSRIREHAEVIGADGVHVGTVVRVKDGRIKLTRRDRVRRSTNGAEAASFEEEPDGKGIH
ncbi:DUF2171 domain-containing protein [Rhizobium sp. FKY42]|uniref:DUF2171 domain-containing protein n=1 Tax=Rhizobium sp. FKY42 TaxID=2562310 RepID=UPI0010C0C3AD|nr:DUF2171 domain-containing protein [Rhizobium sp. FKY42]